MVGIVSYGGYVPYLRLERSIIAKSNSWYSMEGFGFAQGERSIANYDEDTITMAVEASIDSIAGIEKSKIDALYFASTTLPFAERDNAGIIKLAIGLGNEVLTANFSSTLRSGTTALRTAIDVVKGGGHRQILVTASENRVSRSSSRMELWYGDAAGSLVVGSENVIAEYLGSYSVCDDFMPSYRGSKNKFEYRWEDRFDREEGYQKFYPQAIKGLIEKTGVAPGDVAKVIFPCVFGNSVMKKIAVEAGLNPECIFGNMHEQLGDSGSAHPIVMLSYALEQAKPGDKIIVAGYGQGVDAILFMVTDNIKNISPKVGISGYLAHKKNEKSYLRWLAINEIIDIDQGARADAISRASLSSQWRQRKFVTSLIGSKCTKCGYPQLPPARVCPNPKCGAIDMFEDYNFADKPGKIFNYTTNALAVSVGKPVLLGTVMFEGGGRFIMDLTDFNTEEVEVGVPVRMTFRRLWKEERGYTHYFWKAAPAINK